MREFQPVHLVNIPHYKNNKENSELYKRNTRAIFLAYFVLQGSNAKSLSTYNIPLTIYSFHTIHLFVLTHNVTCAYSNRHNKYTATTKTKLVIRFFQNKCALQLIFNLNIAVPLNVCSPTEQKSKSIPSWHDALTS